MNELYHPVKIGSLEVGGNLFLAPLAGFTDKAFRAACLNCGASLTYTEMVSAEALARKSEKTEQLAERADNETLLGLQIFLPDADTAERAMPSILKLKPSLIDINCGCPVPKVVKNGAGSALMRTPEKITEIVKAITGYADIPVTVKFRSGWDSGSINFMEFAEAAARGGASLLAMHPRTRSQGYSGDADWDKLTQLKKNSDIPVIGSGSLFTAGDAQRMLESTGIDGVMFARGAIGNPFIFRETRELLTSGKILRTPDFSEKLKQAYNHLTECVRYKGETTACREMKKQLCSYTKGEPGSAALRNRIVHAENLSDYRSIFSEFIEI